MQPSSRELTIKSVALGLFLAFVFGAANAYLGMKAGQTVAATIPAAVIAMALFRLPAFRGGILEQNIARTAGSVGEALVAGAIFTLPAFLLVELEGRRLWDNLRDHYGQATIILLAGGLVGVFFIILLRKALVSDPALPFPESVASYEIVKAGQEAGDAPRLVFGGMGFGAFVQYLKGEQGFPVLKEFFEGFIAFPASVVRHFDFSKKPIGDVAHAGGIPWATPALSPALIGIGYIIGPQLASINVAGGMLAWWVLIPLLLFFDPDLPRRLGGADTSVSAYTLWFNIVRPIAVGMMLVGAGSTMWRMRTSIGQSLRGAFRQGGEATGDLPTKWVLLALAGLFFPVAGIYYSFTGTLPAALAAALMMGAIGFLLTAVGGYLVGLVGSSNQPLSGLTLSALLLSALLLQALGVTGPAGAAAVLGIASVVAVAVSVSGSLIQDLKAGALLGGTPWRMQVVEIIAVVLLAFFLMAPIIVLHEANLASGGIGGRDLPAPQAGLMAQLAKGIMTGGMAWGLLVIGVLFGVALLLMGARAMMLIAVGMYLPFETSAAIFLGGLLKRIADRVGCNEEKGTLLASGLIAGEALVGILLAVLFVFKVPSLAQISGLHPEPNAWLTIAAFAAIAFVLIRIPAIKRES